MIIPVNTPQVARAIAASLHQFVLPVVVLWVAFSGLMWLPPTMPAAPMLGESCQTLAIAQLFGGLLMLSSCTRRTGAMWTSVVFALTGFSALFLAQPGFALGAFAVAAWSLAPLMVKN